MCDGWESEVVLGGVDERERHSVGGINCRIGRVSWRINNSERLSAFKFASSWEASKATNLQLYQMREKSR